MCIIWVWVEEVGVRGQIGHCLPVVVLHLLQPDVDLWVALVGFLEILGRVALHRSLLRLGPCLKLAMGGLGKFFLRSGLSDNIALWVFSLT